MKNITENAFALTNNIVVSLGYEIVDIEYKMMYNEYNLTYFIYKNGGVSLDDCEKVSKAIEIVLDEADITKGNPYNLNVSSTGLDRLIVSMDDYRRSLETEIEVIFNKTLNKKKAKGTLVSYDESTFTLLNKDKKDTYNKSDCQIVRPYINFK